jgi:uncharacterized membrane protein YqaE (UPF0057 family)
MRYLIAFFLPWLSFFTMGMFFSGVICLILQLTVIGWIPAAIWAFFAINNYYAAERDRELMNAIARGQAGAARRP